MPTWVRLGVPDPDQSAAKGPTPGRRNAGPRQRCGAHGVHPRLRLHLLYVGNRHIPTPSPCSRLGLVGPPGAGVTAADVTGLAVNVVVLVVACGESAVTSISLRQEALCLPCPAVPAAITITCSRKGHRPDLSPLQTQLVSVPLGLRCWEVASGVQGLAGPMD